MFCEGTFGLKDIKFASSHIASLLYGFQKPITMKLWGLKNSGKIEYNVKKLICCFTKPSKILHL